ncbi:MAG: exodeoxyribonuclease VII large subunit [Clostridia bacterium]|nr:exodeoxyribonuclease VII large subunit [Clostridia bacterium]
MGADKLTYTVSQLNNYVKTMIDSDPCLTYIYVVGEISNFTNHYKTGHFYLTLKDSSCAIKAVMFRSNAARIKFEPQNGMKVICRGRASLFERDGSFQFYIDEMQPDGAGALQVAFEQLCEKLKNEGLFDEAHKKPIPKFPERIAVITSPTGAAVQDIKNVISRRCPCVEVVMCPVLVQGDGAAAQLCEAVEKVNELNCADVIIIGRGGGSIEDLWAFNDETLARIIFNSNIPVISAVGHEIDFTVCDFVSDLRAPTPSAGAELAVPDINDVRFMLSRLEGGVLSAYGNRISNLRSRVKLSAESYVLKNPENYIFALREKLNLDSTKMKSSFSNRLSESREAFAALCAKLDAMSPLATIARGYSVTYVDKKPIKSVDEVNLNDCLNVKLVDGVINCTVNNVSKE